MRGPLRGTFPSVLRLLPLLTVLLVACDSAPAPQLPADAEVMPDFGGRPDATPPVGLAVGAPCDPLGTPCAASECVHGVCSVLCTRDDECPAAAALCVGRGGAGRCTPACSAPGDCPVGLVCAVQAPGAGFCVAPGPGGPGSACESREACASWFCSEGRCLGDCEGGTCPEGRTCLALYTQAVCVEAGPAVAEATCAQGSECASGVCRGGRCSVACQPGEDCANDRICITYAALGLCERRCDTSADCGETGFCQPTSAGRLCATRGPAAAGAPCAVAADCASGRCQMSQCAATCDDGTCPAGQACVRDTGGATCRPAGPGAAATPCDQGSDCASGVCGGGLCAADCAGDEPCPAGTRCTQFVDGDFCFPPCGTDQDCPQNTFCDAGFGEGPTCFWRGVGEADAACGADTECASGACNEGRCLGRCPDGVCPGSRTCRDFGTATLCAPDPLPAGASCEAGDRCALALECVAGRCMPQCDGGCPEGSRCQDGRCHPTCAQDDDCRPGRVCNAFDGDAPFCQARGALAAGAVCTRSADCRDGLCFEGTCRARCPAAGCTGGEACVPLGGATYCLRAGDGALGAVCGGDDDCRGGLCVGRRCAEPCPGVDCAGATVCRSLRGGDFCVAECDLSTGAGCLPGEQCAPTDTGAGRCALPDGGAAIGEVCRTLEDCNVTAAACVDAGDGPRCRSACQVAVDDCPADAVCAPQDNRAVGACVPAGRGSDMAVCEEGGACASGWCIAAYQGGHCGRPCLDDIDCPQTSRCVDLARNPGAPFLTCAPRCLSDNECPEGLRCRRGLEAGGACY